MSGSAGFKWVHLLFFLLILENKKSKKKNILCSLLAYSLLSYINAVWQTIPFNFGRFVIKRTLGTQHDAWSPPTFNYIYSYFI